MHAKMPDTPLWLWVEIAIVAVILFGLCRLIIKRASSLSRKAIRIAFVCVAVVAIVCLAEAMRAARNMARWQAVESNFGTLAIAIELYRDGHRRYPASFEELLSGLDAELRIRIERDILHNSFKDQYAFSSASNGFVISVKSLAWLIEPKTIEKRYAVGELLK